MQIFTLGKSDDILGFEYLGLQKKTMENLYYNNKLGMGWEMHNI